MTSRSRPSQASSGHPEPAYEIALLDRIDLEEEAPELGTFSLIEAHRPLGCGCAIDTQGIPASLCCVPIEVAETGKHHGCAAELWCGKVHAEERMMRLWMIGASSIS
jgi:hypothetical protein